MAVQTLPKQALVPRRQDQEPALVAADLALGAGLAAARTTAEVLRRGRVLLRPAGPLVWGATRLLPARYRPEVVVRQLTDAGRGLRQSATTTGDQLFRALVPVVLDAVLDQVDLTQLVIDRVDVDAVVARADVDAVVARADVDAVVARVDLDAILDRIDLVGLAQYVIDEVDLPEIIRDSTGSMASEAVRGVRMRSIDADERLGHLVDRVLLRRHERRTAAPGPPHADGEP